jgi:hypothetical protein
VRGLTTLDNFVTFGNQLGFGPGGVNGTIDQSGNFSLNGGRMTNTFYNSTPSLFSLSTPMALIQGGGNVFYIDTSGNTQQTGNISSTGISVGANSISSSYMNSSNAGLNVYGPSVGSTALNVFTSISSGVSLFNVDNSGNTTISGSLNANGINSSPSNCAITARFFSIVSPTNGTFVSINNLGNVTINGNVNIVGTLSVNGTPLNVP